MCTIEFGMGTPLWKSKTGDALKVCISCRMLDDVTKAHGWFLPIVDIWAWGEPGGG